MNTGRFGGWLHQQRVLVRLIILVLTLTLMFLLRPLSFGDIVLTVVLGLAVWLIAELLQRGPDTVPDPLTDSESVEPAPEADEVLPDVVVAPTLEDEPVLATATVVGTPVHDDGGPVEASAPPKPPRPKRTSS